jgi:hypothetical protein
MTFKSSLKTLIGKAGYQVTKTRHDPNAYDRDGLFSIHNHDFMRDGAFEAAYARGVQAAADYRWQWRVHIGLWAASAAAKLDGDFVECGVNRGFLSSAIMQFLDWDTLGKTYYLLDTFEGLDYRQLADGDEKSRRRNEAHLADGMYVRGADEVRKNFSQWHNVRVVEGSVPDTLREIVSREVAFLHLDMNSAPPEVAAFNTLWERLSPGAIVLLDDYAYAGYEPQKLAMDVAAAAKGIRIASLPTGQGLALKPCPRRSAAAPPVPATHVR